jgi:hypothetical protein
VVYLNETGYRLLYSLNWLTFMPEHIWGDVSDPSNFKPWTEANPTMKGLTRLVGDMWRRCAESPTSFEGSLREKKQMVCRYS